MKQKGVPIKNAYVQAFGDVIKLSYKGLCLRKLSSQTLLSARGENRKG